MKSVLFLTLILFVTPCLISQDQPPVAVDDELPGGVCGDTVYLDVLANDYHPQDKDISIKSTRPSLKTFVSVEIAGDRIMYTHPHFPINMEMDTIYYTIMETDNPDSYSEEAKVIIDMTPDTDLPVAAPDEAATVAGWPITIDVTANDDLKGYTPSHLFVKLDKTLGNIYANDLVIAYEPFMTAAGLDRGSYLITDLENFGTQAGLEVEITGNNSYDSLDHNNINAGIHSDGFLFCKYDETLEGSKGPANYQPHFEYPKGSGKQTIFNHALWIGGLDEEENLHLAAQRYKQVGYDYQFGPVSDDYSGQAYFIRWSRLWKVNQEDVSYHRNNYWKSDYQPIEAIISWPGNGEPSNGQSAVLAPFFDKDNDGLYEPMEGDYPLIRGDQTVFFIFNDDKLHTESEGEKLKVEIHGMAYVYGNPQDTVLDNTVFLHLDLYNRSENTYHDTYLGFFTDIDLGYAWDDYIGSHVALGSFYGYNGTENDGSGEPVAYGPTPPAQSVTVLAGPFMDNDNEDNPAGLCDYGLNGLNFGDGIIDNERMGLTRFAFITNGAGATGDPQVAAEYYKFMSGFWKDNSPQIFGGNGHLDNGGVGPECRFMYPDDSDTCNWGTGGELPNGGYNQNGKYWTEFEVGNLPSDRRGLGVSGPFTFEAGAVQELELAFVIGQGEDHLASVDQLFENLENLFTRVRNGEIIVPNEILDVNDLVAQREKLEVYPNPAADFISLRLPKGISHAGASYSIINSSGLAVVKGHVHSSTIVTIPVENLDNGFYILVIEQQGKRYFGKFLKM
jgi:hypothetical protein